VKYRRITVGPVRNGWVVIRDGLKADERVVVKGLQRVRPNSKVKPIEEKPGDEPAAEGQ